MDALRGMKLVFREKPHLVLPNKKSSKDEDGAKKDGEGEKEGEAGGGEKGDGDEGKEDAAEDKGEDWKSILDLGDKEKGGKEKEKSTEKVRLYS